MYCLPETEAALNFYRGHWAALPKSSNPSSASGSPRFNLLSFEDIERVVRLSVALGIQKVRVTGGEPLLRHDVGAAGGPAGESPASKTWRWP